MFRVQFGCDYVWLSTWKYFDLSKAKHCLFRCTLGNKPELIYKYKSEIYLLYYYISICKSHYLFLSFILQLQSKWHRASTTLDMLPLCAWSVHLSELRFYRWQAGASDEHFIATGRALRSWLWLDIDHICGTFSLYIMPTGSLS